MLLLGAPAAPGRRAAPPPSLARFLKCCWYGREVLDAEASAPAQPPFQMLSVLSIVLHMRARVVCPGSRSKRILDRDFRCTFLTVKVCRVAGLWETVT